jgi:MFS family permease
MLSDGISTLVLPTHLIAFTEEANRATTLGLLSFFGLLVGMLIQPVAGARSDNLRPRWGRVGTIGAGVLFILISLVFFGLTRSLLAVFFGYLLIQAATNVAQAAQQGLIPDLVPTEWRGTAAGLKGLMDVGGAMLGYVLLGQLLAGGRIAFGLLAIAVVVLIGFLGTFVLVRERRQSIDSRPGKIKLIDVFRIDLHHHRDFVRLVVSRFMFLLGAYAVIRFFEFFIADRLRLNAGQAAEQTGTLLAVLALITIVTSVPAGWTSDRFGRKPMMFVGIILSIVGVSLLAIAESSWEILLFGGLMSAGTAAFAGANWALTTDLVPQAEAARFLGLANFGTAGAVAAAGLFGPIIDWANKIAAGNGYVVLFSVSGLAFATSALALRRVSNNSLSHHDI